jgi:hypothetical protein
MLDMVMMDITWYGMAWRGVSRSGLVEGRAEHLMTRYSTRQRADDTIYTHIGICVNNMYIPTQEIFNT